MNKIKQILRNTEAIMDHLGIHDKQIAEHSERIAELERKLRDKAVPGKRRTMVLSRDAQEIADEEDMSLNELYKLLRLAGRVVLGGEPRTTQKQRVNGDLVRVLVLRKERNQ